MRMAFYCRIPYMKNYFRRKYIVVPALLLIYGTAMAIIFGPELVKAGHTRNLVIFAIFDSLVIILAFYFLRKKYMMGNRDL